MALNDINEFDYVEGSESFHKVSNPRIIWIDRKAILEDFPSVCPLIGSNELHPASVSRWMLENCGYVSKPHLVQNDASQRMLVDENTTFGYRPIRYGRAAIFDAYKKDQKIGLVDVKGCGVGKDKVPKVANHCTGLLELHMALNEIAYQKIFECVFRNYGIKISTVPIYCLIDLGFRFNSITGSHRACQIVRSAHLRPEGNDELPLYQSDRHSITLMIEYLLRFLGFCTGGWPKLEIFTNENNQLDHWAFSTNKVPGLTTNHIEHLVRDLGIQAPYSMGFCNIQTCREVSLTAPFASLVDFGGYHFRDSFELDFLSLVRDRPINWGGLSRSSDAKWIQPVFEVTQDVQRLLSMFNRSHVTYDPQYKISSSLMNKFNDDRWDEGCVELERIIDSLDKLELKSSGSTAISVFDKSAKISQLPEVAFDLAYSKTREPLPSCLAL